MFKFFIYFILIVSIGNSAERSMFGAGDLESKTPYGLTSAEKVIIKNKNTLATNEKKIKKVDVVIQDIDERIEGIESLVDGDSQKLNSVSLKLNKQINKIDNNTKLIDLNNKASLTEIEKLNEEISNLKISLSENKKNIESLKTSFDDIATSVNEINKNLVTRAEFSKLMEMLDKEFKQIVKKSSSSTKNLSNKQMMLEARKLFKKDHFTKALPLLNKLLEKNYRPAECNYYIGEIKYYRKKYKDALHYFKTSMMLYDKAKYLPKLLLHSAISFEKTGDDANANNFYTTLVEVYPDSNEAKKASKKIK